MGEMTPIVAKPCSEEYCHNQGSCMTSANGNICLCDDGYTGEHCEMPLAKLCSEDFCHNQGSCETSPNGLMCSCYNGYTGDNCEIPPFNCKIGYKKRETRWSDEKKAWCCDNEGIDCPSGGA